jgi:hypothetical protein
MMPSYLSVFTKPSSTRGPQLLIIGSLVAFVVISWIAWHNSSGDDLSSGYFACRLMAEGKQNEIYSHDAVRFHVVQNPAWQAAADEVGFKGFLHPYVQTPLYAASMRPLCLSMNFDTFNSLFVLFNAISIAGMVWISIKYLSPSAIPPLPFLGILLWLWISHPFRYTMFLTQTHPLFLLATLGALVLAERKKAFLSGIFLACAAIIKITPALLLLYWAITRKWKSIAWFFLAVIGFQLASLALAGIELNLAFLSELKRISNVLLVSWNNESLAAIIMGHYYPGELMDWRILPLPTWLNLTGTCISLCTISLAAWLRRLEAEEGAAVSIALIGMTVFSPIAWSHYYVVLLVPVTYLTKRSSAMPAIWVIIIFIMLMTLGSSIYLFRPLFTSSMIALISCVALSILDHKKGQPSKVTQVS